MRISIKDCRDHVEAMMPRDKVERVLSAMITLIALWPSLYIGLADSLYELVVIAGWTLGCLSVGLFFGALVVVPKTAVEFVWRLWLFCFFAGCLGLVIMAVGGILSVQ